MYDDDSIRIPTDEAELWTILRYHYDLARMVLLDSAVEGREEALGLIDNEESRQKKRLKGLSAVIPYRGTSPEMDNRDHFLEMGCDLLPYIERGLEERILTPQFVQQWGKLMFCHGFIASYALDDSDPLANRRAGHKTGKKRSKGPQRKWIAHIMIPLLDRGMTRQQAEGVVVEHVSAALENEQLRGGFLENWFRPIVTHGELAATYDSKHFAVKKMRELVAEKTTAIPPIPKFP